MELSEIINLRVPREIKARLIRLIRQPEHRGRDVTTLCRMAIEDYCTAQEQKLRMHPITDDEVIGMITLMAAERGKTMPQPQAAAGAVSYRKKPRRRR